jgi:ketosteroid isomerase-like protein
MSSEAMEVVNRWRASNFERRAVDDVLAEDVEWVVPSRGGVTTLRGINAVLEWYEAGGVADDAAPENLGAESVDVSEERGELEDFGEGRVGSLNRLIYTRKESGEVAEVKTARLVYTVRDGKIVRYELENLDDSEVTGDPSH